MIGFFTDPHPDELLYSACARFVRRSRYPYYAHATEDLFGAKYVSAVVDFPNRLDDLIAVLPGNHQYTVDGFIDDNTLLPLYTPFLPVERARLLRDDLRGAKGHIRERLGITAGDVQSPDWLRYCPMCAQEDREMLPETYWHRIHQITGVEVCPSHEVFLESSDAPWRDERRPNMFFSAESAVQDKVPRPLNPLDRHHSILLKIARDAAWLLCYRGPSLGIEVLRHRYYNLLLERGYAYYNSQIRTTKLTEAFIRFYSPAVLARLQCSINNQNNSWLFRLVAKSKTKVVQHPLRHLLLMTFLGVTAEEVLIAFSEYKPFGDAPWPCLNQATAHYKQPEVVECHIVDGAKKNLGKPFGTFKCACGFVYTRTGPDQCNEDRFRVSSVQAYGQVWEDMLRELWEDTTITIREVASKLGVNELTVKRRAIQLGLTYPRDTPGSRVASGLVLDRYKIVRKPLAEELKSRRSEWLAVRKANPKAGRLQLQKIAPYLLEWLRKNDAAWLKTHLPSIKKWVPPTVRVDWKTADVELAAAVKAEALRLKDIAGAPVRVSITAIVKQVGRRAWVEKHLDKLPLTAKIIKEYVETLEAFKIRKVLWIEQCYRREGTCPTRFQFTMRAGLINQIDKTPTVQNAIDDAMERLSLSA